MSCGSHKVATCEECPQQGDGKCKGDCKTVNHCLSTDSSKGLQSAMATNDVVGTI